jgi:hypothetical protein
MAQLAAPIDDAPLNELEVVVPKKPSGMVFFSELDGPVTRSHFITIPAPLPPRASTRIEYHPWNHLGQAIFSQEPMLVKRLCEDIVRLTPARDLWLVASSTLQERGMDGEQTGFDFRALAIVEGMEIPRFKIEQGPWFSQYGGKGGVDLGATDGDSAGPDSPTSLGGEIL